MEYLLDILSRSHDRVTYIFSSGDFKIRFYEYVYYKNVETYHFYPKQQFLRWLSRDSKLESELELFLVQIALEGL